MIKKRHILKVGAGMFWFNRYRGFIGLVQTLVVFYIGVQNGLRWWYYLALIPAAVVYIWLDMKALFPGEANAATDANPRWKDLIDRLTRIEEKLDKEEK
jgi:hypothetical protein